MDRSSPTPIWLAAALLLLSCGSPPATRPPEPVPPGTAPIAGVGHGVFIGPDGREVIPDDAFIRNAQEYYIAHLTRAAAEVRPPGQVPPGEIDETRSLIYSSVPDELLANALFVDWLLERVEPLDIAHLTSINNALRWHYYLYILRNQPPTDTVWTKGVAPEVARRLQDRGIPAIVLLRTSAGGQEYVRECRNAGVPVPNAMFSDEWERMGVFDREFLSEASDAELWLHTSTSPPGVCLALPRYPGGACGSGNDACLLGIICLGTQTSKACFFDNPRGRAFRRGVRVDLSEFVGGVDLVANAQGVCSDCHAGENPFIVHPEKPPFAALPSLSPAGWHDPLVAATWPQNPGPTNLLDAISSTGQCNSCHVAGSAGRFPEVSTQLPNYCGTVLATAAGTSPKATMPPFGLNRPPYVNHINALLAACSAPPVGGGVVVDVNIPDDPGFISPPIVIDPCYQCATQVAVRGAILDAELDLFIDGVSVGPKVARNPDKVEFDVPALVGGSVITARQSFGGAVSALSAPVTVRDHRVDFPAGLPAPAVDPTLIHECGDILAIRHVPGATITVFSNGGSPASRSTSTGWSAIFPGRRPFSIGDRFAAEAELCGDVSPRSAEASAIAGPGSVPAPALNPPSVFAGQELVTVENIVHGARVRIAEATFGPVGSFTWPVSWFPNFDVASPMGSPLSAGGRLVVVQELCSAGPQLETGQAERCEALPAPRIRHPLVGDTYIVVTEAVPGARIRVYDGGGDELGDGAGTVIMLKRAVTGADTLTVVQQLGECTSRTGYQVSVRNVGSQQER